MNKGDESPVSPFSPLPRTLGNDFNNTRQRNTTENIVRKTHEEIPEENIKIKLNEAE